MNWRSRFVLAAVFVAAPSAAVLAQDGGEPETNEAIATIAVERASEKADEAPSELAPIVVTGERIERLITQTTSSVQVISKQAIRGSSMADLYDAFARTANINETQNTNGRTGGFAIRGISDTGVSAQSFGSVSDLASIIIDDVAQTGAGNRAGPYDFWDVDSVEIFRGPQSTNQGRNALAGAVVLRTVAPSEVLEMRARVLRGDFATRQEAVALGGGLPGPFAVRVAAQRAQTDGSVTNTTRNESGAYRERENLRLKLRAEPLSLPDFSALLTVTQAEDHRGQPRLAGDPRRRESVASDPEEYRAQSGLGSLRLNYFLSDEWELSAISASGDTWLRQYQDYNGGAEDDGVIHNFVDDRTRSQELRAAFGGLQWFGWPVRGVVGLYGAETDSQRDTFVIDGYVGSDPVDAYIDGQTRVTDQQQVLAAFGEAELQILPRWVLILGGRVDQQHNDFVYRSNFDLAPTREDELGLGDVLGDQLGPQLGLPADSEGAAELRSRVFLPKLGLRLDGEQQDWSAGFTLQRAYRAGGLSVNFARGSFNEVDPEYTWTAELSLRADWLARRLSSRANLFYTDWRDQQVTVQLSDDPNDAQTENAGRSHLYGFELELDWRFDTQWSAFASVGYTNTRFDEFDATVFDRDAGEFVTVSYAGNRFPGASPRQAAVGLRYGAPDAGGLYGQLDFAYLDGSFRTADNDPEQRSDAYALLNGKFGWQQGWGGLYLSGRNLLDRFYVTQRTFGDYKMAGEPRRVSLELELVL